MKRVLAVTVGGEPDPIVQAVKTHAPDFVIFFVTTEPAGGSRRFLVEHTPKGEPILARVRLPREAYEIITLPNPDDFEDCFNRMFEALAEHRQATERLADYTGGTKTMSAALVVAALLQGWSLSLVTGVRRDTVKVASGTELSQRVRFGRVQIELALRQAQFLYQGHEFAGAAQVLSGVLRELSPTGAEQRRLGHLYSFLRALAAWDRFGYHEALTLLRTVPKLWPRGCELLASIWKERDGPQYPAVGDLVGNAQRRAAQHRYEEAVLRLYRAVELLAQLRLRKAHGLDTSDLDLAKLNLEGLPKEMAEALQVRTEKEGKAWVGLREAYRLLAALGDRLGLLFTQGWEDRLQNLLRQRNQLFLEHGLSPGTAQGWEEAQDLALQFLAEAHDALGLKFEPVRFPAWEELNLE